MANNLNKYISFDSIIKFNYKFKLNYFLKSDTIQTGMNFKSFQVNNLGFYSKLFFIIESIISISNPRLCSIYYYFFSFPSIIRLNWFKILINQLLFHQYLKDILFYIFLTIFHTNYSKFLDQYFDFLIDQNGYFKINFIYFNLQNRNNIVIALHHF